MHAAKHAFSFTAVPDMLPIVVLISGTGSNLRAIHGAIEAGRCRARIAAVISDRPRAAGLEFAQAHDIPTSTVRMRAHPDRDSWNLALADEVARYTPSLVVLAGFMKIVNADFVARFAHRIINVHPALLPLFPGTDAPAQAIDAGVRLSGCTVHLVDAGVDTGPILAQGAVRVSPNDTPETLHARIQHAEHHLLPRVIDQIARGTLEFGARPRWHISDDQPDIFPAPSQLA